MIELRGIRKRYGPVTALAGVDATVQRGEIVGIVGPNGAGKTTLLKVLLGLVRADAGELRLDGVALRPSPAFRASVSYMPQRAAFPGHLTGHEVVALLAALRPRGPQPDTTLLDALRLGPELHRPVGLLSDGTRQKLSAAVTFAFAPDLIVVAAYGLILPQDVLDLPRFKCINTHASVLPRWRGASPISEAILAGDEVTPVTYDSLIATSSFHASITPRNA